MDLKWHEDSSGNVYQVYDEETKKVPYFIVTPDPTITDNYGKHNGQQGFFVKFGDTTVDNIEKTQKAYRRTNPSHRIVFNTSCPSRKLLTHLPGTGPVLTAKDVGPREAGHRLGDWFKKGPGKWLEYRYLKADGFEGEQTNASEWWWVTLNPNMAGKDDECFFNVQNLAQSLQRILDAFSRYDLWPDSRGELPGIDVSDLHKMWWDMAPYLTFDPTRC